MQNPRELYKKVEQYFDDCASIYSQIHIDLPYVDSWLFGNLFRQLDLTGDPVVVDLGTGDGNLLIQIGQRNPACRLIGLDLSAQMIEQARKNLAEKNLSARFIQENIEKLSLDSSSADYVVSNGALHHVQDKQALYSEIYRILKPGGKFISIDGFDILGEEYQALQNKLQMEKPDFFAGYLQDMARFKDFLRRITPPNLVEHPEEFHLSPFELKRFLLGIGFKSVEVLASPQNYVIHACRK